MDICSRVDKEFRASGFDLQPEQVRSLALYAKELRRWNSKMNLTGLKTDEAVTRVLLVGSAAFLRAHPLEPGRKVMDLGSGAGCPGIPLKILWPEMDLTLVESRHKRAAFLKHIIRLLKLAHTRCLPVRAESLAGDAEMLCRFDLVTARAAGKLEDVIKASAPLLARGGLVMAMKGSNYASELESAAGTLSRCGMEFVRAASPRMGVGRESHHILIFRKDIDSAFS